VQHQHKLIEEEHNDFFIVPQLALLAETGIYVTTEPTLREKKWISSLPWITEMTPVNYHYLPILKMILTAQTALSRALEEEVDL
jgi:hypothetical protein